MKRFLIFSFVISCFFINAKFLNANCDDLQTKSKKIKVYNESIAPKSDSEGPKMGVNIENLTEDFYVVITNDFNNKETIVKYSDTNNGNYWYKSPNVYKNVKVIVKVYSDLCESSNSLRSYEATTDVFNQYYYMNICQNNLDLEMCKPFVDNENLDKDEFKEKIEEDIKIRDTSFLDVIWKFIKKYYLYILAPFTLISVIYLTRIILIKRRKLNE